MFLENLEDQIFHHQGGYINYISLREMYIHENERGSRADIQVHKGENTSHSIVDFNKFQVEKAAIFCLSYLEYITNAPSLPPFSLSLSLSI